MQIFSQLREPTGEANVAIKVDCDSLDTVSFEVDNGQEFVVSDRYYTHMYLSDNSHKDCLSIDEVGKHKIEEFCLLHDIEIININEVNAGSEQDWMAIAKYVSSKSDICMTVQKVASCLDSIFDCVRKYQKNHQAAILFIPSKIVLKKRRVNEKGSQRNMPL